MCKRLFLSYGHKEKEICLKICESLRQFGYDVWVDTSHIKAGDDWRRKIFEGISNSNGVIACLSRNSCRKPGVCLNELSIAVGIKGGNIKTILLEDEACVAPPAELCHRQWLDMHDWKDWKALGEEKFNEWFSSKMKSLIEMIEREGEFVGEIEAIRKILNPNISRSRQGALLAKPFWGREWLTEKVEAWMANSDSGQILLLYGDPGIGKSTFAANYVHYNAKALGGIFCERNNIHFNDSENIIRTIAFQMACRLPGYRKVLIDIFSNDGSLTGYNTSELFDLLLANPLQNLYVDGQHETLCFVIDGLDECGDENENVLAQTIKRYADRMPRWLRFVVTSREVASVKSTLGQVDSLELHGDVIENMKDIKEYYYSCLVEELEQLPTLQERMHTVDRLVEASKGIFLYAELMADSIHNGRQNIMDTEHLPKGLSEMFYQWFESCFPSQNQFETKNRDFISLMLAIPEGIPKKKVSQLLKINENKVHDIVIKMEVLLAANRNWLGEETWVFSHQYISEWIQSRDAGRFYCSPEVGKGLLYEYLIQMYESGQNQMSRWDIFTLIDYFGKESHTEELQKIIEDTEFIEKAIHIGDKFIELEEIYKANVCYDLLYYMFINERNTSRAIMGKKNWRKRSDFRESIERRLHILYTTSFRKDSKNRDKSMQQILDESPKAELVEMVRKSLHSSMADKVADSILFHTFEEVRYNVKNRIRTLAVQERDAKQFRGPILTVPLTLIVTLLIITALYLVYVDGQNHPYFSGEGFSMIWRQILRLGLGVCIVRGGITLYQTSFKAGRKRLSKSVCRFMVVAICGLVLMAGYSGLWSTYYFMSLLVALWPVIVMILATILLYKEETRELSNKRSHPMVWTALYYGIVMVLILVFSYRGSYGVDYTDQINWIYMILVADTAYLLFAKPRTDELIRFSQKMYNESIFDVHVTEGLDKQDILRKTRIKMPGRIVMTVLCNILAVLVLFARSERIREIAWSIYYELSGMDCYGNMGWLNYRMNAVMKSIQGNYSSLNSPYNIAQTLPLSWLHSQYGILVLGIICALIIALFLLMKRYIQDEIESEFAVSVQKLILFAFIFQTILGIIAELFLFTNTNIKIVFLGNMNSLLLWILFMKIGKVGKIKVDDYD